METDESRSGLRHTVTKRALREKKENMSAALSQLIKTSRMPTILSKCRLHEPKLKSELKLCENRLGMPLMKPNQSSKLKKLKEFSNIVNRACSFFRKWSIKGKEMVGQEKALLDKAVHAEKREARCHDGLPFAFA